MEDFHHNSNLADKIRESMIEELGLKREKGYSQLAREARLNTIVNGIATVVAGGIVLALYPVYECTANAAKDGDLIGIGYVTMAIAASGMVAVAALAAKTMANSLKNYSCYKYWKSREKETKPVSAKDISMIRVMKDIRF